MSDSTAHPFSTATGADVRVRFCPSPTGTPHVGLIRTALFNWAYARHTGGKLIFRIEDTDAARDSEESYAQILDALTLAAASTGTRASTSAARTSPYRQSQRYDIYRDVIEKLHGVRPHLRELRDRRGDRGAQRLARPRPEARLRQLRARPHRRAEGGVPRRGPRAGAAPARARRPTSASTTSCAARSPSRPARSATSSWCARTGTRCTRS